MGHEAKVVHCERDTLVTGGFTVPPVQRPRRGDCLCDETAAPPSATGGDRTRLLFHRTAPAAVQAGQYGDDETRIEIHRSFVQHCTLALIASFHGSP